jgi:hypothetical protein
MMYVQFNMGKNSNSTENINAADHGDNRVLRSPDTAENHLLYSEEGNSNYRRSSRGSPEPTCH